MKQQTRAAHVMFDGFESVSVDQIVTEQDLSTTPDILVVVMDGARVAGFVDPQTVANIASNQSVQCQFTELFGNIMDVDYVTCRPEDSIATVRSVCAQTHCRLVIVVDEKMQVRGWFPGELLDR